MATALALPLAFAWLLPSFQRASAPRFPASERSWRLRAVSSADGWYSSQSWNSYPPSTSCHSPDATSAVMSLPFVIGDRIAFAMALGMKPPLSWEAHQEPPRTHRPMASLPVVTTLALNASMSSTLNQLMPP